MKKNILIDATPIVAEADGLSHYIINLLKLMPEEGFSHFNFSILVNKGIERKELSEIINSGRYTVIEKKISPIGPKRDWDMFWFLRDHRKRFDLIHITSNNYPLSLKNGICTIHDITFKRYFDNPKFTFNLATTYMDMVIRHCLKRAKKIISVSNSTKNELCKWYKLDEKQANKITVFHGGWEHLKKENPGNCVQQLLFEKDYLFYIGTFRIHKNITGMLKAFQIAIKSIPEEIKLVITGNPLHMKKDDLALYNEINSTEKRVFLTGYLPDECVEQYAKNADAFIFPSLSEGFGLPIIEAFYNHTPILCSHTTSLPEVAGDAALYFDPYDAQSIADAIILFYTDHSLSQKLIEAGQEQLKKFSWQNTAVKTLNVYKECLDMQNISDLKLSKVND